MMILNKKKLVLIWAGIFSLIVGLFFSPDFSEAQPYVPIDALLGTNLHTFGLETSIATGAQTAKEVGQVPGISPFAPSPSAAAALAPTSHNFIARQISSGILGQMTSGIVRWIDSGFNGSSAFVTDPNDFLLGVADQVAGGFINGSALNYLCQPFQTPNFGGFNFRDLLAFNFNLKYEPWRSPWSCTLSGIISNAENYAAFTKPDGFAVGGWDGWFQIIQPQNNAYGAYLSAETELSRRISGAQNIELLKLNWGDGFFSLTDDGGNIITPGKTIASSLDTALGSELRELEAADSFDRILQALSSQLITGALSGGGLKGAAAIRTGPEGKLVVPTKELPSQNPPTAPTDLRAIEVTSSSVTLEWEHDLENISGFYIYRNNQRIAGRGPSGASYIDSFGLETGKTYVYEVSAFNLAGESARTLPITVTIPEL